MVKSYDGGALSDPIVIGGIGARLPGRQNWFDYECSLKSEPRWPAGFNGIRNDVATIEDIDKFDAGAFSVHSRMAANLDPQSRCMLEVVWEALVDAGLNPDSMRGTRTGVWIGCNRAETGEALSGKDDFEGYIVLGNCRALFSNRVSYCFDFKGHSVTVDGGGGTSGAMLATALAYLEEDKCDYAIVGTTNLTFKPGVQLGYDLATAGHTFTRGESVIAVVLTKKSMVDRAYCLLRGVSSSWVGHPAQKDSLKSVIIRTYLSAHVDPVVIDMVDMALVPGSSIIEKHVVNEIFSTAELCRERDINYESGAGLAAVIRACLHLASNDHIVGINDLSLTGNFSHVILSAVSRNRSYDEVLRCNPGSSSRVKSVKRYSNSRRPVKPRELTNKAPLTKMSKLEQRSAVEPLNALDTPIVGAGRTEAAVRHILEYCREKGAYKDEVKLLQKCMTSSQNTNLPYRGYSLGSSTEVYHVTTPGPVWLVCGGVGAQWPGMLKHLATYPYCSEVLEDLTGMLLKHSFDLQRIIDSDDMSIFDDPRVLFVGLATVQCLQIELLWECNVAVAGVVGHSFGEHAAAFVSGCLTRHEFVLTALARGKVVSTCEPGAMAVVTITWEQARYIAVEFGVEVACDNASRLVTMSGTQTSIYKMLDKLKERGQFARLVQSGNRAFHSTLVRSAAAKLTPKLHKIISEVRTPIIPWISSSRQTPFTKEYLSNNLQLPVRFTGAATKIPPDAILVEIGPHPLIKSMLRDLPNFVISLMARDQPNVSMGRGLGQLYARGHAISVSQYKSAFANCGPIGHVVKWNHSESWYIPKYDDFMSMPLESSKYTLHSKIFTFDLEGTDSYLLGHSIDNSSIFPGAGYMSVVIDMLLEFEGSVRNKLIELSDVTFLRATPLSSDKISLRVHLEMVTQLFTVEESGMSVCRGKFGVHQTTHTRTRPHWFSYTEREEDVKSEVFYSEMKSRGYTYHSQFQMIQSYREHRGKAIINWSKGNKILLIDGMLQSAVFSKPGRNLVLPSRITKLLFNPDQYEKQKRKNELELYGDPKKDSWNTESLTIYGVHGTVVQRRSKDEIVMMQEQFTPYMGNDHHESRDVIKHRETILRKISGDPIPDDLGNPDISHILLSDDISTVPYSDLIKDVVFNSLLHPPSFKPVLDIALENLKQRVNIFVVDPFGAIKEGFIPFEKWYPHKVVIMKTVDTLDALFHQLPDQGLPSSSLIICNHVFNETNIETAATCLTEICLKDTLVFVNQIRSLSGITKLLTSSPFCPGPVAEQVLEHLTAAPFYVAYQRDGVTCTGVLLTRTVLQIERALLVNVDEEGDFISRMKPELTDRDKEIILTNYKQASNGLVGFGRCLRAENMNVKTLGYIDDACKNLTTVLNDNINQEGVWGSYTYNVINPSEYASQPSSDTSGVSSESGPLYGFFCEITAPGDLSALQWTKKEYVREDAVRISYSSLNFRDVMIASGKLSVASLPYGGKSSDLYGLGIEYSGTSVRGDRVMGILPCRGLATHAQNNAHLAWKVPDTMSLAEAATLPLAYSTAYYSLVIRAGMKPGQSVLIHCGAGAVGTAAIQLALHMDCDVYTTVSTTTKEDHLLSLFPSLKRENMGHSRSTAFLTTIMQATQGKGVDIVLNSLAGPLLVASARCVKAGGHFVEIGKYDMQQNSPIPRVLVQAGCTIHGVQVDELWLEHNRHLWKHVHRLVQDGLESGVVVPLKHKVYTDVEQGMKYLTRGIHVGKVLVDIRAVCHNATTTTDLPSLNDHPDHLVQTMICEELKILKKLETDDSPIGGGAPTEFLPNEGVYLITGGLGSLGIEVASWLVHAGGSVLLVGRSSPGPGVELALGALQRMKKDAVTIKCGSVTDKQFVKYLFQAYKIVGVFHLAGVLKDGLLTTCTSDQWQDVVRVKLEGGRILDTLCRQYRDNIKIFVCFSSIVAAFGNAGQCSYSYANSALDSLCRARCNDGLPGLSIQWGLIGVGMGLKAQQVCGSNPMTILAFHGCLDKLMKYRLGGVVLVYVPVKSITSTALTGGSALLGKVLKVLGVRELDSQGDTVLSRFGLDSLMAVELSAILARDAGISLSPDQIRDLTFSKLTEICSAQ